jgi:acetyl esterase/lipase
VLFVYGGSWKDGYRGGYEFAGRAFAAKGYLTFVLDYRLMPDHRFPTFVEDVATAIAWVQKNAGKYGGDANRMFAVGHSAGAYNLSLAVLNQKYLEAAGVDQKLIRGIATMAGPFDFLPLDTKVTIETFGREPDLSVTQPITYARGDAPPFLLLTGTDDTTVFPKNSRNLARVLRAKGGSVDLKEYKGVTHVGILLAIAQPFRNAAKPVLEDIAAFFAAHDVNPSN